MGLILTALWAGISPISVPKNTMINKAPRIKGMGTCWIRVREICKSKVAAFIPARTKAPNIIPRIPAISVKKTDSTMI
jgi:hypothetical protein